MTDCHPSEDIRWLKQAFTLARRGYYSCKPNPRTGCVIVQNNEKIGEGFHSLWGEAHAEINALKDVKANGQDPRGSTVYVTLEPCSHHGRTPPCTEALIKAGVARVVFACTDPDKKVNGSGHRRLTEAGIAVSADLLPDDFEQLNPGYVKRHQTGLPRVRIKWAASMDGRVADSTGVSRWISNATARKDVHYLRLESGAVITGRRTVLADDPLLTIRLSQPDLAEHGLPPLTPQLQPLRVVTDSKLQIDIRKTKMFRDGLPALIATAQAPKTLPPATNVEYLELPCTSAGKVSLHHLLRSLADRQISDVLVECGPCLAGAFVQEELVDELVLYLAPCLMGDSGKALIHLPQLTAFRQRLRFKITSVTQLKDNLKVILTPA